MRIVHITRSLDPKLGGTVSACLAYHSALVKMGIQSEVLDLSCFEKKHDSSKKTKNNYGFSLSSLINGVKTLKDSDYIFVHGLWQFHSVIALLTNKVYGTQVIVFPHGMAAKYFDQFLFKRLKKSIYWALVESWVIRCSKAIVFIGQGELDSTARYLKKKSYNKAEIIPYPINIVNDLELSDLSTRDDGVLKLLFIGRNHPIKGLDRLIVQLQEISKILDPSKEILLNVIGDFNSTHLYHEAAANLKVNILGPVYGDNKINYIHESDCLVIPSEYESFSVVVLEGLMNGTKVLASDRVGILKDLKGCPNLIEYNFDDINTLIKSVDFLLEKINYKEHQVNVNDYLLKFSQEAISVKLRKLIDGNS